jgi:HSP20 family molecular chaperone IbpA
MDPARAGQALSMRGERASTLGCESLSREEGMAHATRPEERLDCMQERVETQTVPVKMYATADILTVAAPMPGLEAAAVTVEVTADGRLLLRGALRGVLKDAKTVLVDEWTVGPYFREIALPAPVDGPKAIVTYGNGVVVAALPLAAELRPACLTLEPAGFARGEHRPGPENT